MAIAPPPLGIFSNFSPRSTPPFTDINSSNRANYIDSQPTLLNVLRIRLRFVRYSYAAFWGHREQFRGFSNNFVVSRTIFATIQFVDKKKTINTRTRQAMDARGEMKRRRRAAFVNVGLSGSPERPENQRVKPLFADSRRRFYIGQPPPFTRDARSILVCDVCLRKKC